MENYEKKYKDALERARDVHDYYSDDNQQLWKIESIFPELKEDAESDDERIRDVILKLVLGMRGEIFTTADKLVTKPKVLAWLEKQKEQKPAEGKEYSCPDCGTTSGCTNDESEYDRGYREGHRFGLKQTQEYMLSGGKTFSGLIPCWVNAPSTLQPAHKYHGRNAVIMHENNGGFRCCFIDDEKATTVHLPENTLFVEGWRKKPAEWSEEDENRFRNLCDIINGDSRWNEASKQGFIDWLKSLRPQYHGDVTMTEAYKMGLEAGKASSWKPSVGQMSMLLAVIRDPYNAGSESCFLALQSLYEDLMKL